MLDDEEILEYDESLANRLELEKNLNNQWGYTGEGLEAKKAAMSMLSTRTGMFAKVPIFCKKNKCPYNESCTLLAYNLAPEGQPCPMETSKIELITSQYWNDFDLDNSSFTDRNLVSDIVKLDIMADRCIGLMSKEQSPVSEVIAGITESGDSFTRPEISKSLEAYDKTIKRRNELYQLMMATRKDNKDKLDNKDNDDIHNIISMGNIDDDEEDDK